MSGIKYIRYLAITVRDVYVKCNVYRMGRTLRVHLCTLLHKLPNLIVYRITRG